MANRRIMDKFREKAGEFLAGRDVENDDGEEERKIEGYNTRISSSEEMRMFLLADFLARQGVKPAKDFHESLCEHGTSKRGLGRREMVESVRSTSPIQRSSPAGSYSYEPGGGEE